MYPSPICPLRGGEEGGWGGEWRVAFQVGTGPHHLQMACCPQAIKHRGAGDTGYGPCQRGWGGLGTPKAGLASEAPRQGSPASPRSRLVDPVGKILRFPDRSASKGSVHSRRILDAHRITDTACRKDQPGSHDQTSGTLLVQGGCFKEVPFQSTAGPQST